MAFGRGRDMNVPTMHRGRPCGDKRLALLGWVSGQAQFTMGQVARSLNWPLKDVDNTLSRAVSAGAIRRVGETRVPGAKRPVALYQHSGANVCAVPLAHLMRVWS